MSNTITKAQLAAELAETTGVKKSEAAAAIAGIMGLIEAHLAQGDKVSLANFLILQVKHYKARDGRNPQTGAKIRIAARRKISVRVGKGLKDAVL